MKKKHIAAWLAMTRYAAFAVLTTFSTWLQQIGPEKWKELTSFDWWALGSALGLSALTAIGAIMNNRWSEAKADKES